MAFDQAGSVQGHVEDQGAGEVQDQVEVKVKVKAQVKAHVKVTTRPRPSEVQDKHSLETGRYAGSADTRSTEYTPLIRDSARITPFSWSRSFTLAWNVFTARPASVARQCAWLMFTP